MKISCRKEEREPDKRMERRGMKMCCWKYERKPIRNIYMDR